MPPGIDTHASSGEAQRLWLDDIQRTYTYSLAHSLTRAHRERQRNSSRYVQLVGPVYTETDSRDGDNEKLKLT
jgi:hypothetical protein